jgi:hypothetical protein
MISEFKSYRFELLFMQNYFKLNKPKQVDIWEQDTLKVTLLAQSVADVQTTYNTSFFLTKPKTR